MDCVVIVRRLGFAPFGRGSLTLPRAILQALRTKACAGFAGLAFVFKKGLTGIWDSRRLFKTQKPAVSDSELSLCL